MNQSLKTLTDEALWESTIKEAETERNSTLKVIAFLQEINLRLLHLKRGYSSLHEYCVSVLKYSDGGAYRRIKAMKLVEELPETRESIETGTLNLTTASQIQKVIETKKKAKTPMTRTDKLELFKTLEGKSKREVEKVIAVLCPEFTLQPERQRFVTHDKVQKTLILSSGLHEKIEKLKKLRAHENKDFVVILEELVDRELKRVDPATKLLKAQKNLASPKRVDPAIKSLKGQDPASPEKLSTQDHSRYVPAGVKRDVWIKSNGQCSYTDPQTGKRCLATNWLQMDHIIPFAKGGPTTLENLRLLCANHNRFESLNHFKKDGTLWPTMGQRSHSMEG